MMDLLAAKISTKLADFSILKSIFFSLFHRQRQHCPTLDPRGNLNTTRLSSQLLRGKEMPVYLLILVLQKYILDSYQYQFVKTRFPRIWSNRDMGIFSFRPISPQFAQESPPKPPKSVHPSGIHFGGPFSMLQARFLNYFGAFLCRFCDENVFSGTIFQYFLHFQFVKTRSRRQKVAKATETCFDKL